ncbi:BTB/POZ domain-containing protein 9-like [Drosophila obscura]|uniref:BTB/POZ domain-containing protein 9-like n=1 Tax=Drosophila obscura TaxID=7282 RepID=UPI001BB16A4C|nr:BTB/POZ domain-containing protein 9-like [Drosophila obscura]
MQELPTSLCSEGQDSVLNKRKRKSQKMSTQENNSDEIRGIASDINRLCMNELYLDVEVEDQRLPGHRYILAARSEYFRALLYGDMAESKEREIRLEVPVEAFRVILEYIYSDKLPLSTLAVDKIIDVLVLAHLYGLKDVETAISKYLQQNLAVSNVIVILNAARLYDLDQLTAGCLMFMDNNMVDLLKHDSIQMLSKESFEEVLGRESFSAPEVEIFRTLCKWRENNPNEDNQTLFSLVRLPLMTIDDLLHVVRPSGIFKSDIIFDAIDQVNIGKNLPHRVVTLPGENLTSAKPLAQPFVLVVKLQSQVVVSVSVSCDQTHWDSVGNVIVPYRTISPVLITPRTVRYIRITSISCGIENCDLKAMYKE